MTERRRPLHVGVYLGLSAGAYALSLAGVTALQARSEAAVVADRGPTAQLIAALASQHDSLEANARDAGRSYEQASGAYDRVGLALADVEARLDDLTKVVVAVDGAARALPDHAPLPSVSRTVKQVRPPTVHATTAASGG